MWPLVARSILLLTSNTSLYPKWSTPPASNNVLVCTACIVCIYVLYVLNVLYVLYVLYALCHCVYCVYSWQNFNWVWSICSTHCLIIIISLQPVMFIHHKPLLLTFFSPKRFMAKHQHNKYQSLFRQKIKSRKLWQPSNLKLNHKVSLCALTVIN